MPLALASMSHKTESGKPDRLLQISEMLDYYFFKHYSDYLEERKKEIRSESAITDDTIIHTEDGEAITIAELKRRIFES